MFDRVETQTIWSPASERTRLSTCSILHSAASKGRAALPSGPTSLRRDHEIEQASADFGC